MAHNYLRQLAEKIVSNSRYDKGTGTLFVTNPGISPDILKKLAIKNNFKIGQTKSGEYVSIPRNVSASQFRDKEITQFDNWMDSYTYFAKSYDNLLTTFKVYDLMSENLGEVQLILDSYVDEILSIGYLENPLVIKINDDKAYDFVMDVLHNNKIFNRLPMITKMLAKYGNAGLTLSYPILEDNIIDEDEQIDYNEIDVARELTIRTVNPKYFKVNVDNYLNPINYVTQNNESDAYAANAPVTSNQRLWQPWQFVHFLIEDDDTAPYGKSILWSMRSAFDQLTTLEALLAISRMSKIQRLVISIPMPQNVSVVDAYQYMNEFISNYNNSIFTQAPGMKNGKKIPAATEVLYKPALEGFNIDTIESKIDLSSTEDVEYFLDKILRNSKLPKGYLVGEETITTAQTLEAQDLKFSRALMPLRTALINGMMYLIECILTHGGFDVSKIKVEVEILKPIQISSEMIDKYASIIELLQAVVGIKNMPIANQFQFLIELGFNEKLAKLVCTDKNIAVIKNKNTLIDFLKGAVVEPNFVESEKKNTKYQSNISENAEVVSSISSKTFLKSNRYLGDKLAEMYEYSKTFSGKQILTEQYMKSTKTDEDTLNG